MLDKTGEKTPGGQWRWISLLTAALAGGVILTLFWVALARERRSQSETQAANARLERDLAESRQVSRLLEETLRTVGGPGFKRMLDQAAVQVDRDLTNQTAAAAELRGTLGRVYQQQQDYDQAEKMQREALALNQKLYGTESGQAAASLNELGLVFRSEGRFVQAEGALEDALALRQKLFGRQSAESADSLSNLALLLDNEGRRAESAAAANEALAIRKKLGGTNSPASPAMDEAAGTAGNKPDQAETLDLATLTIQREVLGDEDPAVAKTLAAFGELMRQRDNRAEAEALLTAALSIQRKLPGVNTPDILSTLCSLVWTLGGEGKWPEAESTEREVISLWRKQAGSDNPEMVKEVEGFIDALVSQQRIGPAEEIVDEALAGGFARQPTSVNILARQADIMGRQGRWREAAAAAILALEHDPTLQYRYHLAAVLLAIDNNRAAYEELCQKMVTTFGNSTEAYTADRLAADCLLLPNSGVNLPLLDQLSNMALAAAKGDNAALLPFQACRALVDYRLGRFAEAVVMAKNALNDSQPQVQAQALAVMAMAQWQLGRKDEARATLARGDGLTSGVFPLRQPVNIGGDWVLWLVARISLDEADGLIAPRATAAGKANKQ